MIFYTPSYRGFSLAQLVVVIAIIALLSSVVLANLSEQKKKSRDAQRISDLQQLQLALRLYKDANGEYPAMGCGTFNGNKWSSPGPGDAVYYSSCDVYITGLVPDYISVLPRDPSMENNNNVGFLYRSNGTDYKLLTHATAEKGVITKGSPFARCPASCGDQFTHCSQASYSVYSAGASCW